jgi:hypothetical protein
MAELGVDETIVTVGVTGGASLVVTDMGSLSTGIPAFVATTTISSYRVAGVRLLNVADPALDWSGITVAPPRLYV